VYKRVGSYLSLLFSLGDDGTNKEATSTGKLNQENEHIYNLWCSGRVCCEGMLIQLKVRMSGFVPLLSCCLISVFSVSNKEGPAVLCRSLRGRVLNTHVESWSDSPVFCPLKWVKVNKTGSINSIC